MVERIAEDLRLEHLAAAQELNAPLIDEKLQTEEELKDESTMRRWQEVNFCRRLRKMRAHNNEGRLYIDFETF